MSVGGEGEGVLFFVVFNIALEKVVWLVSGTHVNLNSLYQLAG